MKNGIKFAAATFIGLGLSGAAHASSPDAWKEFAAQVEKKCLEATSDIFRKPQIAVDPQGSENLGLAIVYGRSKEAKGRASLICVVNKKTGVVELGTEMGNDVLRVRKAKDDSADDKGNKSKKNQAAAQDDSDDDTQDGGGTGGGAQ